MSQESDRIYTIPLGKVLLSPDNRRAKRAINMIREFARHHMKTEDVRIDEDVAHQVWARGIRRPPRRMRVRMEKTDGGFVLVSRYEGGAARPGAAAGDAGAKRAGGKEGPVIALTKKDGKPVAELVEGTDEDREKLREVNANVHAAMERGELGPDAGEGEPEEAGAGAKDGGGAADAGADGEEGGGGAPGAGGADDDGGKGGAEAGAKSAEEPAGGGAAGEPAKEGPAGAPEGGGKKAAKKGG